MTTPHRTLLQQALDALEAEGHPGWRLLTALREALAAPEPEPVAEVYRARYGRRARYIGVNDVRKLDGVALPPLGTKLYAATPAAPEPSVDDMPGMWEPSDTFGGEADSAAPPAAPDHLRDVAEKVGPAAPVPDGLATNADEVICPNCAHQFRAIPENVQSLLLASGHEPPFTASPAAPVVPLPRPGPLGLIQYAGVDMLQYAAAVSAAKDKEIAGLRAELLKSLADNAALRERVRVLEDARPEPDCRTCEGFVACARRTAIPSTGDVGCTNGGRYEPLPPVRLWRTA